VTLPEPRQLSDFITAPCRHECNIIKQARHAKKAQRVLSTLNPVQQALLRATAGQCGMDSASCTTATAREVAIMDRPGFGNNKEHSGEASLFCAATLHRFGLPVDYSRLQGITLPESCACCKAPLWDPTAQGSRMGMIFVWQCHLGRCGGDGRRLQPHEAVKKAMRDLVLFVMLTLEGRHSRLRASSLSSSISGVTNLDLETFLPWEGMFTAWILLWIW
jgi:hypothetical protein